MKPLKPRVPIRTQGLPARKSLVMEESVAPEQLSEDYESVAYEALGIPPKPKPGKVYHFLGYVSAEQEAAVDAIVDRYRHQTANYSIPFFADYLDMCKRAKKIVGEWDADNAYELIFRFAFRSRKHTPDFSGYLEYLMSTEVELFVIIARMKLKFYVEENSNKPHGYILGTPGSGKSELLKLLIHTYVTNKRYGSVVVLDATSELVSQVAHWKEFNASNRLVYVRPTLARGMSPTINPFQISGVEAGDYSEEALNVKRVVAQELVEALLRIVSVASGPMRTVLRNCVLVLLDKPGATLKDLHALVHDDPELMAFASGLRHHEHISEYFCKERFGNATNRGTKEAVGRRLDELLSVGTFTRFTCGESTLDLEAAINQRKVILLDLGKGIIGREESKAIGKLIIAMILGMAFRRENQKEKVPCSVVVDECHNYLTESMEDILMETRKYKVTLTLAQQTVGQRMSVALKDAVLVATNLQVVGRTQSSGASRTADLAGVSPDELSKLRDGEFYIRPDQAGEVIKFTARDDLIKWRNSVTSSSWKRTVKAQLRKYYRGKSQPELEITEEILPKSSDADDVPESSEW